MFHFQNKSGNAFPTSLFKYSRRGGLTCKGTGPLFLSSFYNILQFHSHVCHLYKAAVNEVKVWFCNLTGSCVELFSSLLLLMSAVLLLNLVRKGLGPVLWIKLESGKWAFFHHLFCVKRYIIHWDLISVLHCISIKGEFFWGTVRGWQHLPRVRLFTGWGWLPHPFWEIQHHTTVTLCVCLFATLNSTVRQFPYPIWIIPIFLYFLPFLVPLCISKSGVVTQAVQSFGSRVVPSCVMHNFHF